MSEYSETGGAVPPRRRRRRGLWIGLIGAAVLVVGGAGVIAVRAAGGETADVGDCVRIDADGSVSPRARSCSDEKATFEVGFVLDGRGDCGGDYYRWERSADGRTVCLLQNVREGHCYGLYYSDNRPCGTAGTYRVQKRLDGSADKSVCAGGPDLVFDRPPRTYCIALN